MFQLNSDEQTFLRSQIVTLEKGRGKHKKYLSHTFTEQGVAMLSGVLRSDVAIKVSIQIMNAFVDMRRFISRNAEIFTRLDSVERKQLEFQVETEKNFEEVFNAIESENIKPEKGIFFDGQIFDAYVFVCNLIRSAKESIVLIDNYVDDSVLTLLDKRDKKVDAFIYTNNISKKFMLDLKKHNEQYEKVEVIEFKNSHDRFLIIDEKTVYHIGASLKDVGKKWFAFSKFEKESFDIMNRLNL